MKLLSLLAAFISDPIAEELFDEELESQGNFSLAESWVRFKMNWNKAKIVTIIFSAKCEVGRRYQSVTQHLRPVTEKRHSSGRT